MNQKYCGIKSSSRCRKIKKKVKTLCNDRNKSSLKNGKKLPKKIMHINPMNIHVFFLFFERKRIFQGVGCRVCCMNGTHTTYSGAM